MNRSNSLKQKQHPARQNSNKKKERKNSQLQLFRTDTTPTDILKN